MTKHGTDEVGNTNSQNDVTEGATEPNITTAQAKGVPIHNSDMPPIKDKKPGKY